MYQFIFQPEFPGFPGKCPGGFVPYPDGQTPGYYSGELA